MQTKLTDFDLIVSVEHLPSWGVKNEKTGEYFKSSNFPSYTSYFDARDFILGECIEKKGEDHGFSIVPVMGLESGLPKENMNQIARQIREALYRANIETVVASLGSDLLQLNYVSYEIVDLSIRFEDFKPCETDNRYVIVHVNSVTYEVTNANRPLVEHFDRYNR